MSQSQNGGARPPAVGRIARFLVLYSIAFGGPGVVAAMELLTGPNSSPAAPPLCGALGMVFLGIVFGVLAIGFYQMRQWAYTPTRLLVGIWRFGFAHAAGINRMIDSPEVRAAFGLSPLGGQGTKPR